MNIRGIQKTSLIDYPGKICSILFVGGCNLSCKFCHNPDLVINSNSLKKLPDNEVLDFLLARKNIIDGVTITGGEPTLDKDLFQFCRKLKDIGFLVKIDTNGFLPDIIKSLCDQSLVDYFAIDIKTSPSKYNALTNSHIDFKKIIQTLEICKQFQLDYELRTTCIPEYASLDDFLEIKQSLGQVKNYYIQQFISNVDLIDPTFKEITPLTVKELKKIKDFISTFAENCEIRGI